MFKELGPLLRQRTVVMILTRLEDDTIRVNVIPRKLNESENDALTTPLSVAGTAEELDAELPSALVQFVGAHLELKNTLESAKEQMAAAAKAAKAEARSKVAAKTAPARPSQRR
jgi:PRTRC genetic system protein E